MTETRDVAGFDIERAEAWVATHVSSLSPPFVWKRAAGGHSNLTYMLTDAQGRRAVIRRPPLGKLLPKAHDMSREWAVLKALGPTRVPAPAALAFCADHAVAGADFYVMGYVEGCSLYTRADTERLIPEANRATLANTCIDVLANLHALDPAEVGLSNLGKPDQYLVRQVSSWHKSWLASAEAAKYDDPRIHELQRFMLAHAPPQGPARIVHGDFGLHNCLVTEAGAITAVLDWEICTLGDPLADLAYALIQFHDPSDNQPRPAQAITAPLGFPSRSSLAARYSARTGADLTNLDFYFAFNLWKTAAIAHGVYARYVEGKKDSEGVDLSAFQVLIDKTLAGAEKTLARWKGPRS